MGINLYAAESLMRDKERALQEAAREAWKWNRTEGKATRVPFFSKLLSKDTVSAGRQACCGCC